MHRLKLEIDHNSIQFAANIDSEIHKLTQKHQATIKDKNKLAIQKDELISQLKEQNEATSLELKQLQKQTK